MNRHDDLARDLTRWFADTAAPRVPDFTDDILQLTAGMRQRPRWSFLERWLPMSVITLGRQTLKPLPWRTIGLLAVLALLFTAIIAVFVGSQQPRLPAPFGLAANGLVAYAENGDIYTVDTITGARRSITSGPDADSEPRWSRDGTHLAVIRHSAAGDAVAIIDPRRPSELVTTKPLVELDTDGIAWSPDGRSISVRAQQDGSPGTFIIDAATGDAAPLDVGFPASDVYWRPPDGRQLMVLGGVEPDLHFYLLTLAGGRIDEVTLPDGPGPDGRSEVSGPSPIRPSGWTPDGQRFVYQRGEFDDPPITMHVLDIATGQEVIINAGYGHVSNDGKRMVALNEQQSMCVAAVTGGPCIPVGQPSQAYGATHAEGVYWSPDDQWILTRRPGDDPTAFLVDPDGATLAQPSWISRGAVSWQRVAP